MNLIDVINEIVDERSLDRALLGSIVCEGILAAFQNSHPEARLKVDYDKKSGEINVTVAKAVVNQVENDSTELSLRKARAVDPNVNIGDEIWVPFDGSVKRGDILKAKQVIATKIKNVEAEAIYNAFKPKEGEIVLGNIHKLERNGASVKIQDAMAFLPKSGFIPGEQIVPGYPIKALLKEVLIEPRGDNQLILDRASGEFLRALIELEIPEIFEKLVEIKKLARDPGYKSKVLVSSSDSNIDPVGTCIGIGGSRIKPILRELSGEKIDIVAWGLSEEDVVRGALKPAEVIKIEVDREAGRARVWLDEDQRAVAIGKMGKNIALASKLVGMGIELVENGKKDIE